MRQTFPETIRFRASPRTAAEIAAAAEQDQETISAYLRRLVRADIERRGRSADPASHHANQGLQAA